MIKTLSEITGSAAVWQQILFLYLICINIVALTAYGLDKHYARSGKWRISEKTLLLLAAIGGSAGALAGMWLFHHKTRKWKFRVLVPVLLVAQVCLVVFLNLKPGQ